MKQTILLYLVEDQVRHDQVLHFLVDLKLISFLLFEDLIVLVLLILDAKADIKGCLAVDVLENWDLKAGTFVALPC